MHTPQRRPLILCILDGWGHTTQSQHNAIAAAKTPTWDRWAKTYPEILLEASGPSVGLPEGQMGNSEVGHTTIGTGRVVLQDLPHIHESIKSGAFARNKEIQSVIQGLKKTKKSVHIMGLYSEGGVHSHKDHILELIRLCGAAHIPTHLHLFLDGRDTPPKTALTDITELQKTLLDYPSVSVATLAGRFYAMDRDQRWERTEPAYHAIVHAKSTTFTCPVEAIQDAYQKDVTDEFMHPCRNVSYKGMADGDAWIMANFRADRVRQLLHALTDQKWAHFDRETLPKFSYQVGMKGYSADLEKRISVLFPPSQVQDTLGEVLAAQNLTQLRIAETEKYAHVTFFFNGGVEKELPKEQRVLIPSPKVKTYDLQPEMSAQAITDAVVKDLEAGISDVIIMNYANTDMVGHTGKMAPTIKAVETVDHCLQQLEAAILKQGGILMVTADHGNAETMENPKTHQPHTAHTTNPVPFVCVTDVPYKALQKTGALFDVAPTVLQALGITVPAAMTGKTLLSW